MKKACNTENTILDKSLLSIYDDIDDGVNAIEYYEAERKKYLLIFWITEIIFIITVSIIGFAFMVDCNSLVVILIIAMITLYLITMGYEYIKNVIDKIYKKIMKAYYFNFIMNTFNLKEGITKGELKDNIKQSGLFPYYDSISIDDNFMGEISGVKYNISECALKRESADDRMPDIVIFHGVIISFELKKKFAANTILTFQPKQVHKSGIELVKLEDVDFDRMFTVFSDNQIEARYLLNPIFMEKLKNFKVEFSATDMDCSFFANKAIFAISTNEDLFEIVSLFNSLTSSVNDDIEQCCRQIKSIQTMIDYFKFDEKTGL